MTKDQIENQKSIQLDTYTVELDEAIKVGDSEITRLEIRKPNIAALRNIKLSELMQGDVASILEVLPRVCTPFLTKEQINQLEPADIAQVGGVIMSFLQPKSVRAEMFRQQ